MTSLFEENAEVLRGIAERGTDLNVPRRVDFSFVFSEHGSAATFAQTAAQMWFWTALREVPEWELPWDVLASMELVPSCETITRYESDLSALADTNGGRADGWGFFSS